MRAPPLIRTAPPLLALLFSAGCGGLVHSVQHEPAAPVALPKAEEGATTSTAAIGRWWEGFSDPGLTTLVERGFEGNLSRKQSYATLLQLQASLDGAQASWWPSVTLGGEASRSRSVFAGSTSEAPSYQVSAAASYELDLFGRVSFQTRQAELNFKAAKWDVQTQAITLSAQIAELWFQLLEARAAEDLLLQQIEVSKTYLKLVELRFLEGSVGALDVYQQREALSELKGQLPSQEQAQALLVHQLALALGVTKEGLSLPEARALPALPPLPEQGLPASLIQQRPDVKAAQARVEALDNAVGAAVADRFPTISLSASVGYQATSLSGLFDNWIYNLAANLSLPIIDGGSRRAEVRRQEALLKAQLFSYGETVLTALKEIEDALVQERAQAKILHELDTRVALARRTLTEARRRYMNGMVDYLTVLTSLRSLDSLEQTQLSARRVQLSNRVELFRALGGGWAAELPDPDMTPPTESEDRE